MAQQVYRPFGYIKERVHSLSVYDPIPTETVDITESLVDIIAKPCSAGPMATSIAKRIRLKLFAGTDIVDNLGNRLIAMRRIEDAISEVKNLRYKDANAIRSQAINLVFIPDDDEIEQRRLANGYSARVLRERYADASLDHSGWHPLLWIKRWVVHRLLRRASNSG